MDANFWLLNLCVKEKGTLHVCCVPFSFLIPCFIPSVHAVFLSPLFILPRLTQRHKRNQGLLMECMWMQFTRINCILDWLVGWFICLLALVYLSMAVDVTACPNQSTASTAMEEGEGEGGGLHEKRKRQFLLCIFISWTKDVR